MQQGIIFNIQKFSIHDGPGIRTVVFFKGCPLRCRWCSNPESQRPQPELLWDRAHCVRCLTCVGVCPPKALSQESDRIRCEQHTCTGCGDCVAACPSEALSCTGRVFTAAEVMEVCQADQVFYEESGGGVTLSGGEVLAQPDFAEELLILLGEAGIHRAIETSAYTVPELFQRITDRADLILFDLKHHHRERHFEGTGVYNDGIIENLRTALARGRRILPRIPVIPGFNDGLDDAAAFTDLLQSLGAGAVQLLPFHQFGHSKYALLGRDYGFTATKALHPEDLEAYKTVFETGGIEAFF
ncbi:MAG: glycyl-radical enzyme activating protein [Treponema sp.]|nr:glycyl-radical enzyme activating protein [Treponema sp.]